MMLRDTITVQRKSYNSVTGETTDVGYPNTYPARVEWKGKLYSDDNGQQLTSQAFILAKPIPIAVNDIITAITLPDGTVYDTKYPVKQVRPAGSYKISHLEILI